jgi:hypothetical protein
VSRWVCMRCFEANDDAVAACQACGLPRGATPPPGEEPAGEASPADARGGARGLVPLLLRFWWVGLLVVIPVVGFLFNAQRGSEGQITRSGSMAVTELRIGDCFDLQDESADEVQDVNAQPCSQPHEFEMIHIGEMPGADYPTDELLGAWLADNCLPAFDAYVGLAYEQSRYDIAWFQPTEQGWSQGDRSVQCAVADPGNARLTQSLRGSAQ